MPLIESGAIDDVGNTTITEQEWQTGIIRLVSILTDISDKQLLATQARVDDVYAEVLAQIESPQDTDIQTD